MPKSSRPAASLIDVARVSGGDRISIGADVVIVGRQAAAVSGVQSLVVQRATVGRQLRAGLRVTAGYRLDLYNDRSPVLGTGGVQPFDLGTYQHTVTLGITLSNELLD